MSSDNKVNSSPPLQQQQSGRSRHSTLVNRDQRRGGNYESSPPNRISILQQRVRVNSHEDSDGGRPIQRTRSKTRKGIEFSSDTKHGSSSHDSSSHHHHRHHHHHGSGSSTIGNSSDSDGRRRDQFGLMKLDSRQRHLLEVITHWMRRTTQHCAIELARGFNKWKFSLLLGRTVSLGSDDLSVATQPTEQRSQVTEQKNSYLMLFAENEKLREQLSEMKRMTLKNEKQTRAAAMKSVIKIIFRSRNTNKKRYYYDLWLNNSKMMGLVGNIGQRAMQLEVGLQALESERAYVANIEDINSKLQMYLSLTVFFYKWKSRTANMILLEERSLYDKQKKIIFNELLRIKNTVNRANKQEAALMSAAVHRGSDVSHSLGTLHDLVVRTAELNQLNKR